MASTVGENVYFSSLSANYRILLKVFSLLCYFKLYFFSVEISKHPSAKSITSTMVVFAATVAGHFFVGLIRLQNIPSLHVDMNPCQTMEVRVKLFVEWMSIQSETVNIAAINNA